MDMFCTKCGSERQAEAKFCGQCGTAFEGNRSAPDNEGKVFLSNSDQRVPMGSATQEQSMKYLEEGGIWVDEDSDEAKQASTPFDPKSIPLDGTLVPGDCIWATHAYPGKPAVQARGGRDAMAELGQLVGRPLDEIVAFVGPPNSRQMVGDGLVACVWLEMGLFSSWTVTLVFDSYGVCAAITGENSF